MSDPISTFSGLASGVQWRDLVDQILQVDRRPAVLVEQQISRIQTRSSAWQSFQGKLTAFQDAAEGLADGSAFETFSTTTTGAGYQVSPTSDAVPGSYSVEVLSLAAAEKVAGDIQTSASTALGLSGEFWLNGTRIAVDAEDTLAEVAHSVNAANTGSNASGVSATVKSASGGYQLVLTSQRTGAGGIEIVDGAAGLAASLGFTDGTTSLKNVTPDGALSDAFSSSTLAVSTLLGITGTTTGTVTLGPAGHTFDVVVDLDDDLDTIASAIQSAATAAGSSVTATVVSGTVEGETTYRLDISGTTSFADANGVLQTLGVLEGGRSAVAHEVTSQGAILSGGAPATGATLLTALDGGPLDGDTFTVSGTRSDGTAFSLGFTVSAATTVDDFLAALNGASGLNGAATAAIDASGYLVVSDAAAGSSQLSLRVVANNEGGGTFSFGDFATTAIGRRREIVQGADAAVRVDGVYTTSASNTVSDAIPGVGLTLTAVSTEAGVVTVERYVDGMVNAVKSMVDAYNDAASFVRDQFTAGEGSTKPLAADSTLRGMLSSLRTTMQTVLTTGVGGDWTRLAELGIEIEQDGSFSLDTAALADALETDPTAVERIFGVHGEVAGSGLRYLTSSSATVSGTYTVAVTSPAATASVVGSTNLADGFGVADDTLTLTDLGTGKSYEVSLVNGQSAAEVLAAVQTELATALAHTVTSSTALATDALGTAATESTTWDQLFQGGVAVGVQAGDTITVSGRRSDATTFYRTLAITDAATQTLGELEELIQNAVGTDASVALDANGKFVVTSGDTGASLLEVSVSADTTAGVLDLSTEVTQEGRAAARIDASLEGGALRLVHQDYGSSAGFSITYANPGTDTETELGLGASGTEVRGADVAGTIGGMAATGSGRTLTGATGTDVEGLILSVEPTFTAGSVTFSRGVASMLSGLLDTMLGTGDGSIQSLMTSLDDRISSMNDRIDDIDARLERRRTLLIRQFTAMEQAMAVAQNQSSWLAAQIGSLPGAYSSSER